MTPAQQTSRMVRFLSTGRPQLWPGDTPEDGTMRLHAATAEAARLWTDSRYERREA